MTVPAASERVAPVEMQTRTATAVAEPAVAPPRVTMSPMPPKGQSEKWYDKTAVVVVLMIVFFPVGLYALWKNSRYTMKTKGIVTGIVALLLIIGMGAQAAARKNFEDADALWNAGNQTEAVAKYKALVEDNLDVIKEADRPRVFQRIIECEFNRGERSTAQHYIDKAKSLRLAIASDIPEVKKMIEPPPPPPRRNDGRQAQPQPSGKSEPAPKQGVTRATYDAITIGMSKQQVIDMLGEPSSKSETETPGLGTTEMWQWQKWFVGIKAITVFFRNGVVSDKNWTEM